MNVLVIIPTYNERENLPGLVRAVLAYDGYRVMVVDDASPDGTGALADDSRARVRRAGRSRAPLRTAGPGPIVCGRAAAGAPGTGGSHLPDGRGLVARSAVPAGARRGRLFSRRRHRLTLSERRERGELAATAHHSEHVRESVRARRHPLVAEGLHERISLLAARGAGPAPARAGRVGRLRVPRRDAVRGRHGAARGSAKCPSSSSNAGRACRSCLPVSCSSRCSFRGGCSSARGSVESREPPDTAW